VEDFVKLSKSGTNHLAQVSYVAHIGGFIAGLLMGIVVLRNFKMHTWERVVWWIALVGFILLVLAAIIWNLAYPGYPKQLV
jgi:membrane associated rhomboid family serine protease